MVSMTKLLTSEQCKALTVFQPDTRIELEMNEWQTHCALLPGGLGVCNWQIWAEPTNERLRQSLMWGQDFYLIRIMNFTVSGREYRRHESRLWEEWGHLRDRLRLRDEVWIERVGRGKGILS
jgi:hypothetical protein